MELHAFTGLITLMALGQYMLFGILVGRARAKHSVPAPAITGHPEFERMFRVQQNTLEQLIVFIPALWLFAAYISDFWGGLVGIMFIVGREIYMMGYVKQAEKRSLGFGITFGASAILWVGSLVGIVLHWIG
ncbi:MAG: MAPEG family protein [Alphaproteobacteria bacterium]